MRWPQRAAGIDDRFRWSCKPELGGPGAKCSVKLDVGAVYPLKELRLGEKSHTLHCNVFAQDSSGLVLFLLGPRQIGVRIKLGSVHTCACRVLCLATHTWSSSLLQGRVARRRDDGGGMHQPRDAFFRQQVTVSFRIGTDFYSRTLLSSIFLILLITCLLSVFGFHCCSLLQGRPEDEDDGNIHRRHAVFDLHELGRLDRLRDYRFVRNLRSSY